MRGRPPRRAFPLAPGRPLGALLELAPRYWPTLVWGVTALIVTLLGLRFSMRLLGVRQDIPFPSIVYGVTAPLAGRFYPFFPANERFDYPAVEVASLAAAGVVIAVALLIYVVGLLIVHVRRERGE